MNKNEFKPTRKLNPEDEVFGFDTQASLARARLEFAGIKTS